MKINVIKNCNFEIVKCLYEGKNHDFAIMSILKNGIDTKILLSLESETNYDYWYFKILDIEKDDKNNILSIEVEDTIFMNYKYYQIIDKETEKIVAYFCSPEDSSQLQKDHLNRYSNTENCYLKEISKEEFSNYWEKADFFKCMASNE